MNKLFKSKFLIGVVFVLAFAVFAGSALACDLGTTTLKQGMKSDAVLCLQQKLDVTPATGYFGTITLAAVKAFQAENSLTADGKVGALTKAALTVTSPTTPTTTTEALCPNGMTLASNCATAPTTTTTTQALCPNGNTVASNCATAPTTTTTATTTTGAEGSVTITYDAVPANGLAVNKGETKDVLAFKIKATGSDMKVTRFWADLDHRIWLSASKAEMYDGSTLLESIDLSSSTVVETTVGSAWQLQFNSLNLTVPKDTTKVVTLKITRPTLTNASDSIAMAATSTFRATDGAGLTNTYTVTARTINLSGTTTATTGTLTATLSASSPATQNVSGLSTTSGTLTDVKLMDINLKSTDGPINVSAMGGDVTAYVAAGTGKDEDDDLASVELRDGTSVLASSSVGTTGAFTFSSLTIDIPTGTTKTLSIVGRANHIASGYVVKGDYLSATVDTITATTNDFASTVTDSFSVAGNTMYLYQYAPTFTLGTVSATSVEGSAVGKKQGNFSIAFSVTAPAGSDIYVDTATTLAAVAKTAAYGGTLADSSAVSGVTSQGSTSGYDKVSAGLSRTFTFTGTVPDGGTAGFTGMKMVSIKWNDSDLTTGTTTQTWGISDFKTATVYVTAS